MSDQEQKLSEEETKEKLRKQGEMIKKEENQLAALEKDNELSQMYKDNAKVGAENLGGETPLLKVHQVGKSNTNELADGSEPTDGWFFYKPTGEQFEKLDCHILTISKGFRAPGIENSDKLTFNQIMGGVIVEGKDYKPFIIYMTGKKLQGMWDFGKAASKYTHAKPVPIPMFALSVELTTHKEENSFGKSWLVDFKIKKNEAGQPELVMDPGEFQFLKDTVEHLETMIASIIAAKTKSGAVEGEAVKGDMPF